MLTAGSEEAKAGNTNLEMFLLVDDRDGRVVAELEDPQQALDLLEAHARDDPDAPDYLCVVVFQDHAGAMLGTESSVTIRSLPRE